MSDKWITSKVLSDDMISPFVKTKVSKGVISYGLSSYGYDARAGKKFKIFTNVNSSCSAPQVIDIKEIKSKYGINALLSNLDNTSMTRVTFIFKLMDYKSWFSNRKKFLYTFFAKTAKSQ